MKHTLGIVATAAALVLAIAWGSRWAEHRANPGPAPQVPKAEAANQLAIVWSQTRAAARSALEAHDEAEVVDVDADEWRNSPDPDNHVGDRTFPATPSWVTAAMDGLEAESDRLGPGEESNTAREL